MSKFKAKIMSLTLALCCIVACFGFAITANLSAKASDMSVYTIDKIGALATSDAEHIDAYPLAGDALNLNSWTEAFSFVEGSGEGMLFNGNKCESYEIKQPGTDMYIKFGTTAVAGDKLTIDGTFESAALNAQLVFNKCGLEYNGETWVSFTVMSVYTIDKIGALATSGAEHIDAYPLVGDALNLNSWTEAFSFVEGSGKGMLFNGNKCESYEIKQPGTDMYIKFGTTAVAGDKLTIDGTFVSEALSAKLVFNDCGLEYNGETWVSFTDYNVINVGLVLVSDGNAAGVYLAPVDNSVVLPVDSWDDAFAYESGNGITVDGNMINMENKVKSVGNKLYVDLGSSVVDGSVLKIGGALVSDKNAVKYVFTDVEFKWSDGAWGPNVGEIVYKNVMVGELRAADGNASGVYLAPASSDVNLPVDSWDFAFEYYSGNGITIDGEMIDMNNSVKSVGGKLFVDIKRTATEGTVIKIGGALVCKSQEVKYLITDSEVMWNGTSWVSIIEPVSYEISALAPVSPTNVEHQIYLKMESGEELPVQSWEYLFKCVSGGLTVNGEKATILEVKSAPEGLFVMISPVEDGSELVLSGTFYSESIATTYVIEESKFTWDGTNWIKTVEYSVYEVGEVVVTADSTTSTIYVASAIGEQFAIVDGSWAEKLSFVEGSGVGVTFNGTQIVMDDIKIPNAIYINLHAEPVEGDVVIISGTFYSVNLAVKYVIAESKFIFDGEAWRNELDIYKDSLKAQLEEYKVALGQDNYYESEWSALETLVGEGKALIDSATTQSQADENLAIAKAQLDEVLTKAEVDEVIVDARNQAKAELANYKSESDYKANEWSTIQNIITSANAAIDASISLTEVEELVAQAKAEIDQVKTASVVDAEELAAAKATAKEEVQAYYNSIDHTLYSEDGEAQISTFVGEAMTAIDNATKVEDVTSAVETLKTNVNGVAKKQPTTAKTGCQSSVESSIILGLAMIAFAGVSIFRKKENN